MGSFVLAFIAGMVTILSPCVLPLLPIIIGGSAAAHKHGPYALVLGLILSFTAFGFMVVTIGYSIGLTPTVLQHIAAWVLLTFGLVLLIKPLFVLFSQTMSRLTRGLNNQAGKVSGNGLLGQFGLGTVLGLVWSPCVGPTLGAAIGLAAQGESLWFAFGIMLTFAVGTAIPVLALAMASRSVMHQRRQAMARYADILKPALGLVFIGVGLLFLTGWIVQLETWLIDAMPTWLLGFIYSW